jgi:hypothetical protein
MKSCLKTGRNENGSAILLVVFLLAIVTIIGISASNTTDVELNIAGNDRLYRCAFYAAESGSWATAKRVGFIIDHPDISDVPVSAGAPKEGLVYNDATDAELLDEILGQKTAAGAASYDSDPDINFRLGDVVAEEVAAGEEQPASLPAADVEIDLKRIGGGFAAGESAEFGTGSESQGGKQVVVIPFALASEGKSDATTKARIRCIYYKYWGKPGGV